MLTIRMKPRLSRRTTFSGACIITLGAAAAAAGANAIEPLAGELRCVAETSVSDPAETPPAAAPVFPSLLDSEASLGALQETMPADVAGDGEVYVGGRGLITTEGPTGMFINPTSGTLQKGHFTAQYCAAFLHAPGGATNHAHGTIVSFGVTDWLEIGGTALVVDLDNVNHNVGVGGPFFRVRLTKDESWWPELSIGGVGKYGYRVLESQTLFVAASKRFGLDEPGFFRSFRPHVGFRQLWQDSSFAEANGSIVYAGGEIELPADIFLVAEVSNKDDVYTRTPFSMGIQIRSPKLALSVAAIQTGSLEQLSLYAGIGIDY